jgi:hypothetical protein
MRASVVAASLSLFAGGCVSVEHVGRPPSAAEIARINYEATTSTSFAVRYAPGVTPLLPGPQEACAGGACGPQTTADPSGVVGADAKNITFYLRNSQQATVPLASVEGVRVGRDRAHGALIGAIVFASVELGVVAVVAALLSGPPSDPGGPQPSSGCDAKCGEAIVVLGVGSALMGGLIGAAIGAPRVFQFGGGGSSH